jgi:hypothetical protein
VILALIVVLAANAETGSLSQEPNCDPTTLIEQAKSAVLGSKAASAWAAELRKFRDRCGNDPGWKRLQTNPEVRRLLPRLTARGHKKGSGASGNHVTFNPEDELAILALKLGASEAVCPELHPCSSPEHEPLRLDALRALRRYCTRVSSNETSDQALIELAALLRRFGGLANLGEDDLALALRMARVLSDLGGLHLGQEDLKGFPEELRAILREPDAARRKERLIAYFNHHRGDDSAARNLGFLEVVIAQERMQQELGDRIGANQVKVLLDTHSLSQITDPCTIATKVRQATLATLIRAGFAEAPGVYTHAADCPGDGCPVALAFERGACESSSSADNGAEPGCIVLRLRFTTGGVQQTPLVVGPIQQLCADGAASRDAVTTAVGTALGAVVQLVALNSGFPELLPGELIPPQPLGYELRLDSAAQHAAIWIDLRDDTRPPGFGRALAEYLRKYRTSAAGVATESSPPAGATRLSWERPEGALVVHLTSQDGQLEYTKLRFSPDQARQPAATLALTTALTLLNFYARQNLEQSPQRCEQRNECRRISRGYNLLLAGLPGLTDQSCGRVDTSRRFATADASFMALAALLSSAAMVDRTLYHQGHVDSLAPSRWLFIGAQAALLGAVITKIWAFIDNP